MSLKARYPALFFTGIILLPVALVVLLQWVFSKRLSALACMVAGTFITAIVLLGIFIILVRKKQFTPPARTPPENAQSS
jgi:hypothetical protein